MSDGAKMPAAYACKFCGGPLLGTDDGWTYCERDCASHRGLQMRIQEHTIGANGGTFLSLSDWEVLKGIVEEMTPYLLADDATKRCPCCEDIHCNCQEGIDRVKFWRAALVALLTNDNIRKTPDSGGHDQQAPPSNGGEEIDHPYWGNVGDPQIG